MIIETKNKPLFRWVVGDVNSEGFCVLYQAVKNVLKLYKDKFDFLICSNAAKKSSKIKLQEISKKFGIKIYQQSWLQLPLEESLILQTPDRIRQGTFWKLCPPRMRINSHEIICDNDLIFVNPINTILEFLEGNSVLMMKEDAFCVGKYFELFKENENYNSGLYGMPPGYDFEKELKSTWLETKYNHLIWRDEQGLVTGTLKKHNHLTIKADDIIHLFNQGRCSGYDFKFIEENKIKSRIMSNMTFRECNFLSNDKGYHFLGVNRESHQKWIQYKADRLIL